MASVNTIREILGYGELFRGKLFVISIDKGLMNSLAGVSLARDLAVINAIGVNILIICSDTNFQFNEFLPFFYVFDLNNIPSHPQEQKWPMIIFSQNDTVHSIAQTAVKLAAHKLVFITRFSGIYDPDKHLLNEIKLGQIPNLLNLELTHGENRRFFISGKIREQLIAAVYACQNGVERIHFINGRKDGELLKEIFSCEGTGTMIHNIDKPYGEIMYATKKDAIGIYELLKECNFSVLSDSLILSQIERFMVFCVDGDIFGCASLTPVSENMQIDYFAVSDNYRNENIVEKLLTTIVNEAECKNRKQIILTSNNWPWLFINPILTRIGFKKIPDSSNWIKTL